jgi:hypothetical protein
LKTQLVCTFVRKNQIDQTINKITENFKLLNGKIFLLKSSQSDNELILSYNIVLDSRKDFLPGSILVHRKKETNTIYTINALNELIVNINNGILDKKYPIEWERYQDTMMLKKSSGLNLIKTEVVKIYSV